MSSFEFTQFDTQSDQGACVWRWWALRGPAGAVTITAILLAPDEPSGTGPAIRSGGGEALAPAVLEVHQLVTEGGRAACPALDGPCAHGGQSFLAAAETLELWASTGNDDGIIRAELQHWYDAHLAAAN